MHDKGGQSQVRVRGLGFHPSLGGSLVGFMKHSVMVWVSPQIAITVLLE